MSVRLSEYELKKRLKEDYGLTLLPLTKYKNFKSVLYCRNEDGYIIKTTMSGLAISSNYRIFHPANPFTCHNIDIWLKNNAPNYQLLTRQYRGNKEDLEWIEIDSDTPSFNMSWNAFSRGQRNPHTAGERRAKYKRKTREQVLSDIEVYFSKDPEKYSGGWKITEESLENYKHNQQALIFINDEGYKAATQLLQLRFQESFSLFNKKYPDIATYNMKLMLEKESVYRLAEGETYNGQGKYTFYCPKHEIEFEGIWNDIRRGIHSCDKCKIENISGENHWSWNPNTPREERVKARKNGNYRAWREDVYKKDNYTCQYCFDNQGSNLTAHHINGWHWDELGRFDINNGVTLCNICHDDYHNLYGYKDANEYDFKEWLKERDELFEQLRK